MGEEVLATKLARWVFDLDFDQLPPLVVETAKQMVLDQLGLQLLGATLPNVQPERRLVASMQATPESTVVFSGSGTVAPYAAYVNGALATSCEFDDVHGHAGHPGANVVPAALAFGEYTEASGREVIVAIVAGVQVMSLLGAATQLDMLRRGWHGAKVLGVFGAATAAGVLLGLTTDELANAFGIAGSDASGTMEYELAGGEVKRMHAGAAGRSGAQAALLARDGLTGPLTIFEGERGILRQFTGSADLSRIDRNWDHFHIQDVMFRRYPVIGSAAVVLDGIRHLMRDADWRWRDVAEIRLGLPAFAMGHGAVVTRPSDAVSAQFSTAFSVALRLVRGRNRAKDYFDPVLWTDPDVLSVVDKVVPYEADVAAEPQSLHCRVGIRLYDGRELSHFQRGFTDGSVVGKFRDNVTGLLEPTVADEVVDLVAGLDELDEVATLMRPLAVDPSRRVSR
ncbi:MmgE/PrpD family protein [Kutzneria chonburiensis]|uniref:MmgE/PrpD family protein n=1 Tax=Kutzneria chonburiensis TaxID=1483604 RepID=A0ABV6MR78_9PSEU|nr:MmgE/PrpD family protein [Kutzneria chonburiensis]